jgi:hypothetical protein
VPMVAHSSPLDYALVLFTPTCAAWLMLFMCISCAQQHALTHIIYKYRTQANMAAIQPAWQLPNHL